MNPTRVKDLHRWWQGLLHLQPDQLNDPRGPLVNLDEEITYFSLSRLPELRISIDHPGDISTFPPSFKHFNQDIVLNLRFSLLQSKQLELSELWANKLMRYCEIYLPSLRQRAMEKWHDSVTTRLYMLQLSAFLLDYYRLSHDLRFLNTVVKLMDFTWILSTRQIDSSLRKSGDTLTCGLFAIRLILVSEFSLRMLNTREIHQEQSRA